MADKRYVAMIAIDGTKDGERHEYAPGDVIELEVGGKDEKTLLSCEGIREPSEAEDALWERRQASAQRTSAPVKHQTEPKKANGPGGASGESKKAGGGGSVASDTNTVGAGSQGDKDSSQLQGAEFSETDGEDDQEDADQGDGDQGEEEEAKAKPKTKAKRKAKDDLA